MVRVTTKERVLEYVDRSDRVQGVSADEIARDLQLQPANVRTVLVLLYRGGQVDRRRDGKMRYRYHRVGSM